jgi:DNA mismatch repair ATPase MutS
MITRLDEIKGVGGRTKEELISFYGSESDALKALNNQRFEDLIKAGISLQKASDIARFINAKKYGFTYSKIMKTKEGKELFNKIFSILIKYPRTDFGRIGVGLFYPTTKVSEIERRTEYLRSCVKLTRKLADKREELNDLLLKISTLNDLSKTLKRKGNILLIEDKGDLEYLLDFEFVRYVQTNSRFSDQALELPNVEPVYDADIEQIIPELTISYFGLNRESILSAIRIGEISNEPETLEIVEKLRPDVETIKALEKDGISREINKELENLFYSEENLESVTKKALTEGNAKLSKKISEMSIKGEDVLYMLQTTQLSLPRDFTDLISATAKKYEDIAAEELRLDPGFIRGLFHSESFPLEIDEERLQEIRLHLTLEKRKLEFYTKQRIAQRLSKNIPLTKDLMRKVLELDLKIALGGFYLDHGNVEPRIQNKFGIGFKGGRNLFFKGAVQPVDYVIGACPLFPGKNERAVIITGANSGGKTSLIELVAQVVILTQMGIGVSGVSAGSSLFEEIYYFGKGKGDNAGAFETLLRTFEKLSGSSRGRLILADEVEAITEPGAAAKILAALLEWFKEDKNTLIAIVTHLGEDIKEHVGRGIRIDGIEARGLDENLNLVVDRNPILGKVARSTPELIVERLSGTSSNKRFYASILERFKN